MYKRANGTWCGTVPQGKGKPHKFFYGKTRAEVSQKIADWKQKQEDGISVADALDEWIQSREGQITEETIVNYSSPIRRLKEAFGETPLKNLQASEIQALISKMVSQRFSHSAVNTTLMIMSMTFDHFIVQPGNQITFNPCSACRIPSSLKAKKRDLPSRDVIEKIKSNIDHPFGLFPFLLIYTGCRKGEALALTDKDIFEDHIHISKTLLWLHGESIIKGPKTPSANRDIVLLPPLKEVLPQFTGYLFSDDGGKTPLTQSKFQMRWQEYCLAADLAHSRGICKLPSGQTRTMYDYDVCPHQLRHEFATICFDANLDAKDAADLLGHASERTTREIYTHIQESRRTASAAKLIDYVTKNY